MQGHLLRVESKPAYCCSLPASLQCHNMTSATCNPQGCASTACCSTQTSFLHLLILNAQAEPDISAPANAPLDFLPPA